MKNKEKAKKINLSKKNIVIIFVGLLLIISLILIFYNKKTYEVDNTKNSSHNKKYTCQKKIDETDTYDNFNILTFIVENDYIKNGTIVTKLVCKNKEVFANLINNQSFIENKKYDENELSIIISSEEKDYTKDSEGKELNLSYNDYKKVLENEEYTCDNEKV